jgi:uncharacterized Fe-S center protein
MTSDVAHVKNEEDLVEFLEKELASIFSEGDSVLIKTHMGEPGNRTHIPASLAKKVIDVLVANGCRPFIFDSPVVYSSPRNNEAGYLESASRNGFYEDAIGAPVIISNRSETFEGELMAYELCSDPLEADGVLLLSHFKGHMCSGMGGAIKNVGMGCMSKSTKGAIHTGGEPVYVDGCTECGMCVENCPTDNVRLAKGRPFFDASWCPGCSNCIISCPEKCITPKTAQFDSLLAEAATIAFGKFGRSYSINVMQNMTQLCDCIADSGPVLADDSGFVCGADMVSVDIASLRILEKVSGSEDIFEEHNKKSSWIHVKEAARMQGRDLEVAIKEYGG